jgi:hydroxyethylthiazole kinase-like uncharacterized protein yjeF
MQKVFRNCYAMDQRCYEAYGLTEDILMEHAAEGMAGYIRDYFPEGSSVLIVSGVGNNGADGIVLARLLSGNYNVKLLLPFGAKSPMAKLQLERMEKLGIVHCDELEEADVIVDALFGAGLNRKLDEQSQVLLEKMNSLRGFKIACDIPSGIGEDGRLLPVAFRAEVTITMGALKEALYLDAVKDYVGEIICVNLGLDRTHYEMESETYVLGKEDLKLPVRERQTAHKGSFGHASFFCGEKEGAAIIAGTAALRFGAGLATLVIHEQVNPPAYLMSSTVVPESTTALAVGMGLGSYFENEFIQKYVLGNRLPLVLDADSFYSREILSVLEQKERQIVLTPHPKEFASLWKFVTGEALTVAEIQENRLSVARKFSEYFPHVVLLLKGANMLIVRHGKVWINSLGSSRLSKAGSGDVLSGLIVSLLAQGENALDAAIQGSLALVLGAEQYSGSSYAMLPTDLIEEIGKLESCAD